MTLNSSGAGPDGQLMRAVRLHEAGEPAQLRLDRVPAPSPGPGEALVRVHAAAITRDELDWPVDRLPAIRRTSCPEWCCRWATEPTQR